MAYQNEHILTLDNQLFTVLQKSWHQLKGGANVTASLYSQCALTCEVSNPGRVEYLCCDVTGLCVWTDIWQKQRLRPINFTGSVLLYNSFILLQTLHHTLIAVSGVR